MSTSQPRLRKAWAQQTLTLLIATCFTLLAISAGAAAHATQPTATISSAALRSAIVARAGDRRSLAADSYRLRTCLRTDFRHCGAQRLAVKRARARLARAKRNVLNLSARIARHRQASAHTHSGAGSSGAGGSTGGAPGSGASGSSSGASSASGGGSAGSTGSGTGSGTSSSGSGASGSVFGSGASGLGTGTGESGNSAEGGGSSGSGEQTKSAGSARQFETGVVSGSALTYELPFIQKLGAHTARMEFGINTSASQMAPIIEAYARAGIRSLLLATFDGRMPSSAEAENLASWAAAFGPGGTLWQGKSFPVNTAVTDIEFGNETSYSYQYSETSSASNWYALPSYATRAQTYALRFKAAQSAIAAVNPGVGMLAQADDGGSGSAAWVDNMFAAVPDLAQRVAGWTIHPYGPQWQSSIDRLVSSTAANGAPSTIPIYVTEWGLSTDNGRCLQENYGWNRCMTYSEAASTLESTVSAMRARYGDRLAALYVYQAHDQAATGTTTEREAYFGALQSTSAAKGAYTTEIESLLSANP
jgi:hypothetical protein